MDVLDLDRKLRGLAQENRRRPAEATRDDLLRRSVALEAVARRTGRAECVAAALRSRADVLLTLERHNEAIGPLLVARQVLEEDTASRQSEHVIGVLAQLAEAQARLERWTDVRATCAAAIPIVERLRADITPLYLQSAYLRFAIGLYTWGARAAWELGDTSTMLRLIELSKSRAVLRYAHTDPDPGAELASLEAEFRALDARAEEHEEARRALWDRIYLERFRVRNGDSTTPDLTVGAIQACLEEAQAALAYYWLDPERLLVIGIDRDQVVAVLQRVAPKAHARLTGLATTALNFSSVGKHDAVRPGPEISDLLLPEALAPVLEGKRRLSVSGHRMLHSIAFSALEWRDGYLIEEFALTSVPNLSSMLLRRPAPRKRQVLALGIADYGGSARPLPNAPIEAAAVRDISHSRGLPATLLCGPQANTAVFEDMVEAGSLADFSCLHLATHGREVNAEAPMEAGVLLHDGWIDGLSISGWHLNAELVVLSACSSGQRPFGGRGLSELPGDELFGLQAAFFAAGARQVLSALWPVNDQVAAGLMVALQRSYLSGVPADLALQHAVIEHLASASEQMTLPYYWAPFFLSALGRAFTPTGDFHDVRDNRATD